MLFWSLLLLSTTPLHGSSWLVSGETISAPYERYILSPSSRNVSPTSVYRTTGSVTPLTGRNNVRGFYILKGPNASITFDFGRMIAGTPALVLKEPICKGRAGSCGSFGLPGFICVEPICQGLGVAFSESAQYVGQASDNSIVPIGHQDGTLYFPLSAGQLLVPSKWNRGSFRYLTLSLGNFTSENTQVQIKVNQVSFTASPDRTPNQLREYTGNFHSSSDLLNRIWYAGAYTLQLCAVGANSSVNHVNSLQPIGWSSDSTASGLSGTDILLTNGAKRDRNPWAGDVGIALDAAKVSLNHDNLLSTRNVLQEIIILQDENTLSPTKGYFPYAGSPLGDLLIGFGTAIGIPAYGSDTYHLWAIAGFCNYFLATGDQQWASRYWQQIVDGIGATEQFVDPSSGLFIGNRTLDWGRIGQGSDNCALNVIYHQALTLAAEVAPRLPQVTGVDVRKWLSMALKVKHSVNTRLFDNKAGLFRDNSTAAGSRVYPQDGNALAVKFNVTNSPKRAKLVAANLAKRLARTGAPAPELPGSVSPFISSHEVDAQFLATPGDATNGMKLITTQWRYMMDTFSNSTFIEGYGTDGALKYGFYGNNYAFISHTHGWSAGPISSLMRFIVGLQDRVASEDGSWIFKPSVQGSGLTHASGGYSRQGKGMFAAAWKLSKDSFIANVTSPMGEGTLYLPTLGRKVKRLVLNGKQIQRFSSKDGYIRVPKLAGSTTYDAELKFA